MHIEGFKIYRIIVQGVKLARLKFKSSKSTGPTCERENLQNYVQWQMIRKFRFKRSIRISRGQFQRVKQS